MDSGNGSDEPMYKAESGEMQTQRRNLQTQRGGSRGRMSGEKHCGTHIKQTAGGVCSKHRALSLGLCHDLDKGHVIYSAGGRGWMMVHIVTSQKLMQLCTAI